MDYIEKAIETIRNDWFSKHVATIQKGEATVIYFKEKGTFMYGTKFVIHEGNIFVSGDIGEAVYSLHEIVTLDDIKRFDLYYLTDKLVAHSGSRWNFDSDLARKELDQVYKDYNREKDVLYKDMKETIEDASQVEHYQTGLNILYETTNLNSDFMEEVWDFGHRLPLRFIAYWVGLQMVVEQFEKEEVM